MENTERTILTVLNEGGIEFSRILTGDKAFVLKHRNTGDNTKIILFVIASNHYRMFRYLKNKMVKDSIDYNCIENTWSVFNSLSLINAHPRACKQL